MLRIFFVVSLAACTAIASAAEPQKQPVPIDRVEVIVNDDVITRRELDERVASVTRMLLKQKTSLPDRNILERQVQERMIIEKLQAQFAKDSGMRVDDAQLDKTILRIAQQNKFPSVAAFRAKLEQEGTIFKDFREEIRTEMISVRLREREVDGKLVISENDVDNYLSNQERQEGKGEELQLAHIMIVVPEQASADKIQTYRTRAEQALAKLRGGESFAQVAAGFSDAQDALKGGEIGWRPADRLPPLFAESLQKMKPGEVSPILRSPNGFHIVKLLDRRSKDTPVVIMQTHARHILIKTSELVSENEAKERLQEIKQRIDKGADFAEQARLHSEDGSASQGGDLGWLSPGETVPEFEGGMDSLKVGQVSGLVQSGFGWHLIQVLERRNTDVSVEQKRQRARNAIRTFKSDEAFQDWLRQLRDRAFVEYRNAAK
ncbi:MAG: molecular chaperone SurA [Sideroxydans sp. GWF2_59_14]|nr:peptidylprolyl isomerase [Sideroxyarcus sp.]OHC81448.1 MAG: molecular chaperone SurA [Sideroxydans sp. GWF2_59_14]HAF44377.1 molecular chaperone SurA [Gallionellaceae bacterium]